MKETLVRDRDHDSLEQRVFVLAPTGKDAALTASVLETAGVTCVACPTLEEICEELAVRRWSDPVGGGSDRG